jgi:putative membrane protein
VEDVIRVLILFTKLAINALALVVVDQLFAGIWLDTWQATVAAAVVLALVNTCLRPLIVVLTLPINILTLGLFTLVINALLLQLVSRLIPGFHIEGFWNAAGGALVISLVSVLLNWCLKPNANLQVRVYRH